MPLNCCHFKNFYFLWVSYFFFFIFYYYKGFRASSYETLIFISTFAHTYNVCIRIYHSEHIAAKKIHLENNLIKIKIIKLLHNISLVIFSSRYLNFTFVHIFLWRNFRSCPPSMKEFSFALSCYIY